jgi:NADH-quinone oxidoreductase subunit K
MLTDYLIVSGILFALGIAGVAMRRNLLVMLMSVEMCLNAANLTVVALQRYMPPHPESVSPYGAQVMTLFVIALAAAEVAVGLALIVALFRVKRSTSVEQLSELKA